MEVFHGLSGPSLDLILQSSGGSAEATEAMVLYTELYQFDLAKEQCKDPKLLGAWLPMLGQYGPALLVQCQNAIHLSESLVSSWLETYMFAGESDAGERAARIAKTLANHQIFKTHGRHLNRDRMKSLGLEILNLEDNQGLQDAVLSVFHAASHTFGMTPVVKIVENHLGKAFIRVKQMQPQWVRHPVPHGPVPAPPQPQPDPTKSKMPADS